MYKRQEEDDGPDKAEDERVNGDDVVQLAPEEPETVVPALALNEMCIRDRYMIKLEMITNKTLV